MNTSVTIPPDHLLDLLTSLVDASLVVQKEQTDGTGRYRLLEPTRQYAQVQLSRFKRDLVERRHADYFFSAGLDDFANGTSSTQKRKMWPDRAEAVVGTLNARHRTQDCAAHQKPHIKPGGGA